MPPTPPEPSPHAHRIGQVLVALQFLLIGVLGLLAWPVLRQGAMPWGAWLAAGLGAGVGVWALAANRPGNFNIHPAPRAGGQLVQHGPYRWIRHPMYSAVLCFGVACAWASGSAPGWASAALLAVVLALKAGFEERWMLAVHPGYAAYRARSWRFVPGFY
jgi:protein-S-isoprenylcysteine O-methyltransferase Ste14